MRRRRRARRVADAARRRRRVLSPLPHGFCRRAKHRRLYRRRSKHQRHNAKSGRAARAPRRRKTARRRRRQARRLAAGLARSRLSPNAAAAGFPGNFCAVAPHRRGFARASSSSRATKIERQELRPNQIPTCKNRKLATSPATSRSGALSLKFAPIPPRLSSLLCVR